MKYLSLLPLAGLALAAPPTWEDQPANDACLAAVTGKAALGDDKLRKDHCSSFLHTIVTPPAVTVTSTVTGKPGKDHEKRASVTVCPNEVPNYASACDPKAYSAACGKFGITEVKTETLAPTTTTVFVWVRPTGAHGGPDGPGGDECEADSTVTVTVTKDGSSGPTGKPGHGGNGDDEDEDDKEVITVTETETKTITEGPNGPKPTGKPDDGEDEDEDEDDKDKETVTVTKTEDGSCPTDSPDVPDKPGHGGKCLTDESAKKLVDNFRNLLEFTSYNGTQGAPGRGYNYNISAVTLAEDFVDISDSINFMAGFPLGSITFPNKKAFDYGQGVLQPEVITETLNIFHDCSSITWRWKLTPKIPNAFPIVGINYFLVNEDGLFSKNYAEFNNGAWLQSFGRQCAVQPVKVTDGEWAKRSISA